MAVIIEKHKVLDDPMAWALKIIIFWEQLTLQGRYKYLGVANFRVEIVH
jgi:hypothetical protein